MAKVYVPECFDIHNKAKARHNFRRKETAHIKEKRVRNSKTLGKGSYLYKYYLKDYEFATKRDENGNVIFLGYIPCKPKLVRWNMGSVMKDARKFTNKRLRKIPLEAVSNGSYYKKVYDIAQVY